MSASAATARFAHLAMTIGVAAACAPTFADTPAPSAERILARTKVLASDAFEGRAPGTPGEDKTVAYLTAEFKKTVSNPAIPTAPSCRK